MSAPSVEPPPLAGLKDRSDSGVAEPNNGVYSSGLDPAYNRRAVKKNAKAFFRLIEIMARNN